MSKSLHITLCQEIGSEPFWRAEYLEESNQGTGGRYTMPIVLNTNLSNDIENLLSIIKLYQPDAPPDLLSQAKARKLLQIQNEWNQQLQQGWNSGRGRLGLTAEDVALLSGAFALAKEANALGLPLPSLVTLENTLIEFQNLQEMTQLMLQYGSARSYLSIQFAAKRKAVEDATTVEEVEAI